MVERLGEMRKRRRERIEKVSRVRIIEKKKETKREKEGLRDPPFLDPTSWSSKFGFYKLIESKNVMV